MNSLESLAASLLCVTLMGCASSTPSPHSSSETTVLASGAAISGANGMQFGPDGLLYVASVIGSEIVVLDAATGEIKRRITEGVNSPDDIAFHSDGSIYWTSILSGEVAGIRSDGSAVIAAPLSPGTNPITFSPDDRLFVSQCFFGDKLYEVDPNGIEPERLISDKLGPGCGLNGMDWGPDGRLYGPRWFHGTVVSFDVDTLEMKTEITGLRVPAAVKFDSKGRLHILDTGAGTIVRIGETPEARTIVATLTPGLDNIAFDANDQLFVSSFVDGFVARINADGSHTMIAPAGMAHPGGVALRDTSAGQEIVVADMQSLRGFDAATGEVTFVHRNVLGVGEMGSVTNVAVDGAGNNANIILTSWLDGVIRVWNTTDQKVVEMHKDLVGPVSAVRYAGRIVAAEHGKSHVIALATGSDSNDAFVIAEGLPAPTGLVVRGEDLYVTDRVRGELLRIAKSGVRTKAPEVVASGLMAPEGVAATRDGFVVVEGDSGRIVLVSMDGAIAEVAATNPGTPAPTAQQPPSMLFNGVAVTRNGEIISTGETDRVLFSQREPVGTGSHKGR